MRINFSLSGGFSGIRRSVSLDTATMPGDEARELEDSVNRAGFFDLPEVLQSRGADRLQYKLTIERDALSHSVQMDDGSIPAALSPLIKKLEAAARANPTAR
jgi:emfourin